MLHSLKEKLSRIASLPGVYMMKDAAGNIIYIGKAQNLKKRIISYFRRPRPLDTKTGVLVKKIFDFETIITGSEKEALILESNLIKRYKPRYNVILKDDKRYPALRLDVNSPYPGLAIVRKIEADGAIYFGPFASSQAVRQTLKVIQKAFKLRKCKTKGFKNRTRPCLNHQIGICLAPCCLSVDSELYKESVREVILFLRGKTPDLIQKIKKEMTTAARLQNYEIAAVLRDKLFAIEKTLEKQVSVSTDLKDRDILAVASASEYSILLLLLVRGGYLMGSRCFEFKKTLSQDAEITGAFLRQYYDETRFIPKEILVSAYPEDVMVLEDWLKDIKGETVKILAPQRGEKVRLVKMALQNAHNTLKELAAAKTAEMDILHRLQQRLKTGRIPRRIECIDNSNISGREPVSGLVVFKNGKPHKASYRTYRIKAVTVPDDYAYMAEVLSRRFKHKAPLVRPDPDLLMVDGGKGQLNIAVSVLKSLKPGRNFEIIGIAKKDEKKGETEDKVYRPGRVNPVNFGRDKDLLFFLQRIRDEAHRFAISFHRKRRRVSSMRSTLDSVPGIGKKRKEMLLKHFGGIKKIRAATVEELSALPGISRKIARAVHKTVRS